MSTNQVDAKAVAWRVVGSPIYDERVFLSLDEAEAERDRRRDCSRIQPLGVIRAVLTDQEVQDRYNRMADRDRA